MFFKNGYFKNTICLITILALLLQSLPLQAQAFSLRDLLMKIRLPDELKLEDDGDIMLGSWRLIKCLPKRLGLGYSSVLDKDCYNPFSAINIGSDQTPTTKDGIPDIPRPKIPEMCELSIPLPQEEEMLTKEERRALSKACSDFIRIQRTAATIVYFAKKIFNNTDPLSECLFLRNCKTSCNLRFGEVSYTISWLDIAEMFLPMGWINTLRKIFNFVGKLNEIRRVIYQLPETINQGIRVLNDFFQQAAYLRTFYDSLTTLLNVKGGELGFRNLLDYYSDSLLKFSQAKSETYGLIGDAQRETIDLREKLKEEEGVKFLFAASSAKRNQVQGMISEYLSHLETPQQLVTRLEENGNLLAPIDLEVPTKGKWVYCPEGKYVTGVHKNSSGKLDKIRCSSISGTVSWSEQICSEDILLRDNQWKTCPDGQYVVAIRKNNDWCGSGLEARKSGKAHYIRCCSLIEGSQGAEYFKESIKLKKDEWNLCPGPKYQKFVIGISRDGNGCTYKMMCSESAGSSIPEISYPDPEIPLKSCYISDSNLPTIPIKCIASLSEDKCIFSCPDGDYQIIYYPETKEYYDPYRVKDFTFFDPELPPPQPHCFVKSKIEKSKSITYNVHCPKREWSLPFPQQFGENIVSHPEVPGLGGKIGEVTITCPGNCTVYCYTPSNTWFKSFKEIYDTSAKLSQTGLNYSEVLNLFNQLKTSQENLSKQVNNLPTIEIAEGVTEAKYWTPTSYTIYAENFDDAEQKAKNKCGYEQSFAYHNWDSKTETVLRVDFDPIIEGLENIDQSSLSEFLTIPIISSQLKTTEDKLTEIEETIEEAKPECIEIHLEAGGWGEWDSGGLEYCPEGMFVDAIHKNDEGQANRIRCCNLPETVPEGERECSSKGLSNSIWNYCPDGRFVTGIHKNKRSKADEMTCCNSVPGGEPGCNEQPLADKELRSCPDGRFVNGIRKNWDAFANKINCCSLPEERIPEQVYQDFDTALDKIGDLKSQIEQLKNHSLRINQIWHKGEEEYSQKKYVEDIIETKEISQDIVLILDNALSALNKIMELKDSLMNTPGLSVKNREKLKEIFSPTGPLEGINQLLFEDPESIKNFVGTYSCPEGSSGEGFLGRLKCFEQENTKTFEQIWHFLNGIEKLNEIIPEFDEIRKLVAEIKPILEIPIPQITDVDLEIGFKGIKTSGGEGFESFKDKFFQSPLSFLKKQFDGIDNSLTNIKKLFDNFIDYGIAPRLSERFSSDKDFITGYVSDERLLEKFRDNPSDELNKIKNKKYPSLRTIIFGNEKMKSGCQKLDLILKMDPKQIECDCKYNTENCEETGEMGKLDKDLLDNKVELTEKCQIRYELVSGLSRKGPSIEGFETTSIEEFAQRVKSEEISDPKQWWKTNICEPVQKRREDRLYFERRSKYTSCTELSEVLTSEIIIEVATKEFRETCSELEYQKGLEQQCNDFAQLKENLADEEWRTEISGLLGIEIPDLTKEENEKQLKEIRELCATELFDIRTPLEGVMEVYSVLLGIKSGTLFFRGIKTTIEDTRRAYESAQQLIAMIEELPEKLKAISETQLEEEGLSFKPLECIPNPAIGYGGLTSVRGGPVCPRIDHLFSVIESNFAIMRQNLNHLNLLRKEEEHWDVKIGDLKMRLLNVWLDYSCGEDRRGEDCLYFKKVTELYNWAEEIKKKTQNVWALATAINFANANCTCGKSYCHLPFCISGLPLTPSPLKDPYCYLVYILRYPFLHQVEVLEGYEWMQPYTK